ncbi:hypothetical protein C3E78_03880 [Aeromicrobium chenweiae]|uniref:Polysaccharide chain length determinant N-terminal domain-containing protein n=2 Tax=Aeromicrobium chenweiae TaxID=2079793 RepID=A0A2S0WJB0_9ACTN|nr:hypothetical protein C3E78_03880 [Aeromicrobium chenweiae]
MGILRIMRRRWYVVAIGLALLAGAVHHAASRPGVYWSQADVVILLPQSARYPNVIEQSSQSLIAMAGVIERDVNRGAAASATSSAGVTLAGEGIRDGHAIKLPNNGGQWATNFDRPALEVQVVGPDRAAVEAQMSALLDKVRNTLTARQDALDVPQVTRITASVAPATPPVFHLDGSPAKAVAATLVLGGGLIPTAAVAVDRQLLARSRRRQPGREPARHEGLTA